jgi:hypothetical protein
MPLAYRGVSFALGEKLYFGGNEDKEQASKMTPKAL